MKNNEIRLQRFFESILIITEGNTAARSERIIAGNPGERIIASRTDNNPAASISIKTTSGALTTTRDPELCPEEDQAPVCPLLRHRLIEIILVFGRFEVRDVYERKEYRD